MSKDKKEQYSDLFGSNATPRESQAIREKFGATMTPRERMEVQRMMKRDNRKGRR